LNENSNNLEIVNKPSDLAYIIDISDSVSEFRSVRRKHGHITDFIKSEITDKEVNLGNTLSITKIGNEIQILLHMANLGNGESIHTFTNKRIETTYFYDLITDNCINTIIMPVYDLYKVMHNDIFRKNICEHVKYIFSIGSSKIDEKYFQDFFNEKGICWVNYNYLFDSRRTNLLIDENTLDSVELHGYRINNLALKEILYRNNLIEDCAVTIRGKKDEESYLTIFCVLKEDIHLDQVENCLKLYLPEAIFPIGIVNISAIPYNDQGFLDINFLENIKFLDTLQVAAVEKALKSIPMLDVVSLSVNEKPQKPSRLHINDYLFRNRSNKNNLQVNNAPFSYNLSSNNEESEPFAIIHGSDITIEADEPVTLTDILYRAGSLHSDKGIIYIDSKGNRKFSTYRHLINRSEKILSGYMSFGLKPGDKIILLLENQEEYISAFWGCIIGGFVPVPVTVPKSFEDQNNELNMLFNIWESLNKCVITSNEEIMQYISSTLNYDFDYSRIISVETLNAYRPDKEWHISSPDDTALLLFTSGSTGKPKGVIQTHKSILARERGTTLMNDFSSEDISLNWMPLEHVGGIVMFHIKDVYTGCLQIHVKTEYIINDPLRWIDLLSEYRATISWAPNFAFALVNEQMKYCSNRTWDLSNMKFILNGGEAINANTAKEFLKLLGNHGLGKYSMKPSWGMSETCSGVVYSHKFTSESDGGIHCLDKYSLNGTIQNSNIESDKVTFVELGKPIPGVSIRIVDNKNRLQRELRVGRLQIKGPNVTKGYYNNQQLNSEVFTDDGWFDTGDLGFIKQGCMTITGRAKDIIIINGININSVEVEAVVEEVDGVETSYTAACAVREENSNTEKLVIFYCSKYTNIESKINQIKEINKKVVNKMGISIDSIIPLGKEEILKTSIGKIQKAKLCKFFEEGHFGNIIREIDLCMENEKTLPSWFYRKTWCERNNLLQSKLQNKSFVIFGDNLGLGKKLAHRLEEHGSKCVIVSKGKEFKKIDKSHYTINHKEFDDYKYLFEDLYTNKSLNIIHMYTYNQRLGNEANLEEIKDTQYNGMYSLLTIVKALSCLPGVECNLTVVSNNTQGILQDDCINYAKGTLLGYLKSIALELFWLKPTHMDLELNCRDNADFIIKELKNTAKSPEVAYRKNKRMLPYITKVNTKDSVVNHTPIKPEGVYLVTGGLGGIGTNICKRLVKDYKVKLVIIGRTTLPPRCELMDPENTNITVAKRIKAYKEIITEGGEFIYEQGDVYHEEFLTKVLKKAEERWNKGLSGVIHLAGDMENIHDHWVNIEQYWAVNETKESLEAMLHAKAYGCVNLHQLTMGYKNMDFIVFSSTMSYFGAPSFSAYSSVNSFIDSFCAYRINTGYKNTYCLNWSMWDNTGMSENASEEVISSMNANGFESISLNEGFNSMLLSLQCGAGQMFIGLNGQNSKIKRNLLQYPANKQLVTVFVGSENKLTEQGINLNDTISLILNQFENKNIDLEISSKHFIDTFRNADLQDNFYDEEFGSFVTEVENKLKRIWKDILNKTEVNNKDNFFELGGHSLRATRLAASINKAFNLEVSLSEIFRSPTIEKLARYIIKMQYKKYIPIHTVGKREFYPVSSAQKRMYILSQWNSNIAYNIPFIMYINGRFDTIKAEQAFYKLIKRHEALRTSFHIIDGEIVQIINDNFDFKVQYLEVAETDVGALVKQFIRLFDLAKAPLIRVAFAKLSEEKYLLMFDLHHIIFDGVSLEIFTNEFEKLYESNASLSNIRIQYKDFAVWQNELRKTDFYKKQENYWLNIYQDKIPILNFPVDYPRPEIQSFVGDTVSRSLSYDLTMKVNEMAIKTGSTNYMVLLAAFIILLSKYTGQEDIIVGTGVAGRSHADLENTIGMFVNMLAVRNYPLKTLAFIEFLDKVKENSLLAFENQDYPFEELIEKLNIPRDLSRNPLFDVAFAMQNAGKKHINLVDLDIASYYLGTNFAKFDLALQVAESNNKIVFMMEYCTRLFYKETINQLLEDYVRIIENIVEDSSIKIEDIKLLNGKCINSLLKDFEFNFSRDLP
jgi:acyl-CoA synthetase (AMP-forming)/AMP-acid ligase II/NAD(P)-dependent dehydrogenase (short-subunit alcohol dehydrogenase family)/acyl carrier protein